MLEKLLGVGSFGGYISHLTHRQTILLTSSGRFDLPLMVQITTPAYLGCWALIVLALIIHFQQDDHLILLDAVAHVETNTSPF
jgi:hypothetical protein